MMDALLNRAIHVAPPFLAEHLRSCGHNGRCVAWDNYLFGPSSFDFRNNHYLRQRWWCRAANVRQARLSQPPRLLQLLDDCCNVPLLVWGDDTFEGLLGSLWAISHAGVQERPVFYVASALTHQMQISEQMGKNAALLSKEQVERCVDGWTSFCSESPIRFLDWLKHQAPVSGLPTASPLAYLMMYPRVVNGRIRLSYCDQKTLEPFHIESTSSEQWLRATQAMTEVDGSSNQHVRTWAGYGWIRLSAWLPIREVLACKPGFEQYATMRYPLCLSTRARLTGRGRALLKELRHEDFRLVPLQHIGGVRLYDPECLWIRVWEKGQWVIKLRV